MIKFFALLLLLANLGFFAWHQGHLAVLGLAPEQQREPQRVDAQVRPESLKVLTKEESRKAEIAAAKPPECLLSPALDAAQSAKLLAAAPGLLGAGGWQMDTVVEPARWIAYMGKYISAEAQAKKKAELRALGVAADSVRRSDLEPGLSLGGGPTRADAEKVLADAAKRGVRTGKVLEEKAAVSVQRFKLAAVDEAQRPKLTELAALGGFAAWAACK